jgi:hypothetical protein
VLIIQVLKAIRCLNDDGVTGMRATLVLGCRELEPLHRVVTLLADG